MISLDIMFNMISKDINMREIKKLTQEFFDAKHKASNVISINLKKIHDPQKSISGPFDIRKETIWESPYSKLYIQRACYILKFKELLYFKWSM